MAAKPPRKTYINLAVKDLKTSMDFFATLGFSFNPKFTDDNAACMVISDGAYAMLLKESFFRTFTRRELCPTTTNTEALIALSCESRGEVDDVMNRALAAGGTRAMATADHGFMYVSSFYDPDGHHWEVFWMDPKAD